MVDVETNLNLIIWQLHRGRLMQVIVSGHHFRVCSYHQMFFFYPSCCLPLFIGIRLHHKMCSEWLCGYLPLLIQLTTWTGVKEQVILYNHLSQLWILLTILVPVLLLVAMDTDMWRELNFLDITGEFLIEITEFYEWNHFRFGL